MLNRIVVTSDFWLNMNMNLTAYDMVVMGFSFLSVFRREIDVTHSWFFQLLQLSWAWDFLTRHRSRAGNYSRFFWILDSFRKPSFFPFSGARGFLVFRFLAIFSQFSLPLPKFFLCPSPRSYNFINLRNKMGIDLIAGGQVKNKNRSAPHSENVYIRLLVKVS